MTDRRAFLATLGLSLLAAPVAGRAQQPGTARIGVLLFSTPAVDPNVPVFREAMRDLGWVEGRNLALEYRYAEGRAERLPEVAAELVRLKPDLIYALGGDVAPFAKNATRTIPIVALTDDLVGAGLVASHAHPGGSTTGVSIFFARTERETTGTAEGARSKGQEIGRASSYTRSELSGESAGRRRGNKEARFGSG